MEIFSILSEVVKNFSVLATTIIPIITLMSLIIPRTRKWLGHKMKSILDFDSLVKHTKENGEQIAAIKETLDKHLEKDKEKIEAQMNNMKNSLLRDFHFYTDRGYITLEELAILQEVYESYRKFGGNGLIKSQWENKILKLPEKPQK